MHTRKEQMEAFGRFLDILDELREKCPWDRKQTNDSLRPKASICSFLVCMIIFFFKTCKYTAFIFLSAKSFKRIILACNAINPWTFINFAPYYMIIINITI